MQAVASTIDNTNVAGNNARFFVAHATGARALERYIYSGYSE